MFQRLADAVRWVRRLFHGGLLPDEYQCAACDGVFVKTLTEEEEKAQLAKEFPGFTFDQCDRVCDDCYHGMGFGHAG